MFEVLSKTRIIRNSIIVIIILLLSTGTLTLIIFPNYGYNLIDEQSDSITIKYYAYAGGAEFHYHTGHGNYKLLMAITEPGRFNITYYYFDGSTNNINFSIRKWSMNDTID